MPPKQESHHLPFETSKKLVERSLELATLSATLGEVPVGAVISRNGEIISEAHNEVEARNDPTAHAEILAIQRAASKINSWRLSDCILCVTLEPCPMCAGAIVQSRIPTIIFSTRDPVLGACGSKIDITALSSVRVIEGILDTDSAELLKKFFKDVRGRS